MFLDVFQGGEQVQVFDAKINPKKESKYKNLFKITNRKHIKRIFDKETKGYIYEMNKGVNTKLIFPKSDKASLGLI